MPTRLKDPFGGPAKADMPPTPVVRKPASPSTGGGLLAVLPWVAIVVLIAAFGGYLWLEHGSRPTPSGPYDPAFVSVGNAYRKALGPAFGDALEKGATLLDSGQPRSMANDTIAHTFAENRTRAYEQIITPALVKVVPESKTDADLTEADRAALAKAYRGLRRGLEASK